MGKGKKKTKKAALVIDKKKSEVTMTSNAKKDFEKLPQNIKDSFQAWVKSVSEIGLADTNKVAGYNTEHLTGKRKGQRSIRLNRAYRTIYTVENGEIQIVEVREINKHEY